MMEPKEGGMARGWMRCGVLCLGVVMVLAAAVRTPALAAGEMGQNKFKVGDVAPDFTVTDLAGKQVKLSAFAGQQKVVLLNFWGLRCGACLEEIPYLEEINKKFAGKGLVVLGVDTDGVDSQTVIDTMKEMNVTVTYAILTDPDFKVTDTYTNFLVPLTIVIDRKGVIQYIHTGFEKGREKEYEDAVKKVLGS
jgi:peroxiredoxin